jgi:TolB-like protein/DNA-binding winged helix-turn-helix (wHTH) protein
METASLHLVSPRGRIGAFAANPRENLPCKAIEILGRQLFVDGKPVVLGARAFDVLKLLVRHRERIVTKRELLEAAWPGLVVEENNLQVQVSNLRRILGRDAIMTIPAQGYQLNINLRSDAGVGSEDASGAPELRAAESDLQGARSPGETSPDSGVDAGPTRDRSKVLALVFTILTILMAGGVVWRWRTGENPPDASIARASAMQFDRSVAVLPFADMSEKKDLEYFSEGLAEEVLHLLSRVPDMQVAARTSSFSFKDKSEDLPTIARKLQVGNVLEGSVRRSGNSVRITAQLVRAENGYHLWSQTYDRKLGDIFQIQEEIAASIVQALQLSMLGERIPEAADSKRAEAYTLYLQGRSLLIHAGTRADWENVDEYARRAISADVTFAPAWAFFARVLADRAQLGYIGGETGWEAAREAATRSLSLDPNLREGQLAIASIALRYDWNWVTAREQLDAVLQQDPGNALAMSWAGYLALVVGQYDRAISYYEHATSIDPLDPNKYIQFAYALYLAGRYTDAQIILHKALALDNAQAFAHALLARIALAGGDPDAALAEADREPNEEARLTMRAIVCHALGRKAESDAALAELERNFSGTAPVHIATVLAYRGNLDRAFAMLEQGYRLRDSHCMFAKVDPLLANLRGRSEFTSFLRRMNLADVEP